MRSTLICGWGGLILALAVAVSDPASAGHWTGHLTIDKNTITITTSGTPSYAAAAVQGSVTLDPVSDAYATTGFIEASSLAWVARGASSAKAKINLALTLDPYWIPDDPWDSPVGDSASFTYTVGTISGAAAVADHNASASASASNLSGSTMQVPNTTGGGGAASVAQNNWYYPDMMTNPTPVGNARTVDSAIWAQKDNNTTQGWAERQDVSMTTCSVIWTPAAGYSIYPQDAAQVALFAPFGGIPDASVSGSNTVNEWYAASAAYGSIFWFKVD